MSVPFSHGGLTRQNAHLGDETILLYAPTCSRTHIPWWFATDIYLFMSDAFQSRVCAFANWHRMLTWYNRCNVNEWMNECNRFQCVVIFIFVSRMLHKCSEHEIECDSKTYAIVPSTLFNVRYRCCAIYTIYIPILLHFFFYPLFRMRRGVTNSTNQNAHNSRLFTNYYTHVDEIRWHPQHPCRPSTAQRTILFIFIPMDILSRKTCAVYAIFRCCVLGYLPGISSWMSNHHISINRYCQHGEQRHRQQSIPQQWEQSTQ